MATAGIPTAEIVHTIEGRTRLRVASPAGDRSRVEALAERLVGLDGVLSVRTRPLIGTVVIDHDGPFEPIAARAQAADLFVVVEQLPSKKPATRFGPGALPATGALAMGAIGVFQLFQARILPPALTLFWYALSLAREAQAADQAVSDADADAE